MRERRTVGVMSSHSLVRLGIAQILKDAGHQLSELESYSVPRSTKTVSTYVLDLDHATDDTQTIVSQLRGVIADGYLVVIGTPMRIAASANHFANAELETARLDAAMLRAAVIGKPPRGSSELSRAHRLWADITRRQRDVLRWLAIGLDNPTIADHLGIGERAVKAHISALLELFDVSNRTKLALLANQAGLRPPRRGGR
jgi:two-component system, NarL family, nitrate/nitrite response regulator NarL